MTQASQPFSVRAGRAQPRAPQLDNFDEETVIRLKRTMVPAFSQLGGDAKALVDDFFTPDNVEYRPGWPEPEPWYALTLLRGSVRVCVAYDAEPAIEGVDSKHIDWREAIRQALDQLLGGEDWPVAFDFCEFLLGKHDEFIRNKEELAEIMVELTFGCAYASAPGALAELPPTTAGRRRKRGGWSKNDAGKVLREKVVRETNKVLERMNVGYRLRKQTGQFDSIISPASGAVDHVLALSYGSVRGQMADALAAFGPHSSDGNPDYGNAAHKAMHAAWSAMEICTGEKTFGVGVQKLRKSGKLPSALAKALGNLYGFTSQDGKGMRHPVFEGELPPDMATARFVVETCASFISYIMTSHPDKFASPKS